jgi:hypothetical protein
MSKEFYLPLDFSLNLSNPYPDPIEDPFESSKDYGDRPWIQLVRENDVQVAFIYYR